MGVTHVIRGDDHLTNAARQQQIYEALGWPTPTFAHIPLIHGSDGAKLSKRHGALGVEAYRDEGFLPEGLMSYLIRLGWAHGDEEIVSRDRALEVFDLSGVNKAPARLDPDKAAFVNAHFVKAMSDDAFLSAASPFFQQAGVSIDAPVDDRLKRGAACIKDRCRTLKDAPESARFVTVSRPLEITGKAAKPLRKEGVSTLLSDVVERLETVNWADSAAIDAQLKAFAEERDIGFGAIGQPLRAALTGGAPSPSLGEVLFALGKTEALARIHDQIA